MATGSVPATGGRDNDPRFFSRMKGEGAFAQLIRMRFANTVRKLGMNQARPGLRTDLFRPPGSKEVQRPGSQLSLI